MATGPPGVFGSPITVDKVRATKEYPEPITQMHCSDLALKMIKADGKEVDALTYLEDLKADYASCGDGIAAECLIYNATGTTLKVTDMKDWSGHIHSHNYPSEIQNGQWGAYLHVPSSGAAGGPKAAVVFRAQYPDGKPHGSCDWLFAWCIPRTKGNHRVYVAIHEEGHFLKQWVCINQKLENSGDHSVARKYGYISKTEIGQGTTSTTVQVRATFSLLLK